MQGGDDFSVADHLAFDEFSRGGRLGEGGGGGGGCFVVGGVVGGGGGGGRGGGWRGRGGGVFLGHFNEVCEGAGED